MAMSGQPCTSGNWVVSEGNIDQFIEAWTDFTRWSKDTVAGAEFFFLIRDTEDPRHFLSFGAWADADAVQAWRGNPEFGERLGRCRALCDEFQAGDYNSAAVVQ